MSITYYCEVCDGPGWMFIELDKGSLSIEHCSACNRFDSDLRACQHLAWLITQALGGKLHTKVSMLMNSNSCNLAWEELDQ